jgi:hypothetical protein
MKETSHKDPRTHRQAERNRPVIGGSFGSNYGDIGPALFRNKLRLHVVSDGDKEMNKDYFQ